MFKKVIAPLVLCTLISHTSFAVAVDTEKFWEIYQKVKKDKSPKLLNAIFTFPIKVTAGINELKDEEYVIYTADDFMSVPILNKISAIDGSAYFCPRGWPDTYQLETRTFGIYTNQIAFSLPKYHFDKSHTNKEFEKYYNICNTERKADTTSLPK